MNDLPICLMCYGPADHGGPGNACPGEPRTVEEFLEREARRRNPVATRVVDIALKLLPWLRK